MVLLTHALMESPAQVLCQAALRLLIHSVINLPCMLSFQTWAFTDEPSWMWLHPSMMQDCKPKQVAGCHPWNLPSLPFFLVPGRDFMYFPPSKLPTPRNQIKSLVNRKFLWAPIRVWCILAFVYIKAAKVDPLKGKQDHDHHPKRRKNSSGFLSNYFVYENETKQ